MKFTAKEILRVLLKREKFTQKELAKILSERTAKQYLSGSLA